MGKNQTSLIINSPYCEPSRHWQFVEEGQPLERRQGRRKAGYMVADPGAKPYQDKGIFVPLELANRIRPRVAEWRNAGYPGTTGITKALLEHWKDEEQRDYRFFFCQIEAIETLIWLAEAPAAGKAGIDIPGDGGEFRRLCCKLATGTGKTVVMAMLIAWQVINKVTYPQDKRFSKNIFVVAPGLTVRNRLSVLNFSDDGNYYDEFGIVPLSLTEKLRQGKILVRNWHALNWESEEQIKKKKGVDKRGAKSDEAYVREVLGDMAGCRNIVVINDEAHHAWRVAAESKTKGVKREEIEEATKWVGGLDRIHKVRGILNCFDFSATPFAPTGKKTAGEALFEWIVSDFGLNDAIEAGLVKTPRIVVRDDALPDAQTYKPRLYHIFNDSEVKDDLNRSAEPHEPLPDLVTNAYALLGADWKKTKDSWDGRETPPVMITVANRTETAARIKHAFDNGDIPVEALGESQGILHIDSRVLKEAEEKEPEAATTENGEQRATRKQQSEILREKVNTVGQAGKPGEKVQNVISVGMLSEGWDARTVTQIMGLRAFSSQLLCEQVVGRGLRRASYEINEATKLFDAEYVNVFGVPFSFLPHEEDTDAQPPSQTAKITVQPVDDKQKFSINWPNVLRIDKILAPSLSADWGKVDPLKLNAADSAKIAEIAPMVNGNPDVSKIEDIDLEQLMQGLRMQTMIFKAAKTVWESKKPDWKASPGVLMAQLASLAEQFFKSDRIQISPASFSRDEKRRRLVIALNMAKVIRHFWQAIEFHNTEKATIVLDSNHAIRSTGDMRPWRTGRPCEYTKRSHINYCVFDSTWESSDAFQLDRSKAVAAWVKNDHLGFEVLYVHNGVVRKYRPDFLIQLKDGGFLVLETKGQQSEADDTKHAYMKEWVEAVNDHGGFGRWEFVVAHKPGAIVDILAEMEVQNGK